MLKNKTKQKTAGDEVRSKGHNSHHERVPNDQNCNNLKNKIKDNHIKL